LKREVTLLIPGRPGGAACFEEPPLVDIVSRFEKERLRMLVCDELYQKPITKALAVFEEAIEDPSVGQIIAHSFGAYLVALSAMEGHIKPSILLAPILGRSGGQDSGLSFIAPRARRFEAVFLRREAPKELLTKLRDNLTLVFATGDALHAPPERVSTLEDNGFRVKIVDADHRFSGTELYSRFQ
jgi:hypothetical protein